MLYNLKYQPPHELMCPAQNKSSRQEAEGSPGEQTMPTPRADVSPGGWSTLTLQWTTFVPQQRHKGAEGAMKTLSSVFEKHQ